MPPPTRSVPLLARGPGSTRPSSRRSALEGAFDESGQNNQLLYVADLGDEPLSVDGANVSGTFLMNARAPERPHGDQVEATLDARC